MTFYQTKCPNCGANLTVKNGLDTFFCQYCGTELISDGQSDVTIRAKADVILADKAIERERQQQEYEERKRKSENRSMTITFFEIIGVWLLFLFIIKYVI